ncbi:hypothetical protein Tco_0886570 [Tanacetum coccineum]
MVTEMEAMNDQDEYYDNLRCLRDRWRIREDKLRGLNETIVAAEEEISTLETQLEMMDAAINSEICLFRSHIAEYGARYAQFVIVHTYVTAVIEAEVRIMQKLQENGQNRTNTDTGTEIVHKS